MVKKIDLDEIRVLMSKAKFLYRIEGRPYGDKVDIYVVAHDVEEVIKKYTDEGFKKDDIRCIEKMSEIIIP